MGFGDAYEGRMQEVSLLLYRRHHDRCRSLSKLGRDPRRFGGHERCTASDQIVFRHGTRRARDVAERVHADTGLGNVAGAPHHEGPHELELDVRVVAVGRSHRRCTRGSGARACPSTRGGLFLIGARGNALAYHGVGVSRLSLAPTLSSHTRPHARPARPEASPSTPSALQLQPPHVRSEDPLPSPYPKPFFHFWSKFVTSSSNDQRIKRHYSIRALL